MDGVEWLRVRSCGRGGGVVEERMFGAGRWGCDCTRPEDRSGPPADPRKAGGESYLSAQDRTQDRWPVRHRGSQMRRKTLTGNRATSGFQVRKTVRRAGEGLSRVLPHGGTVAEERQVLAHEGHSITAARSVRRRAATQSPSISAKRTPPA